MPEFAEGGAIKGPNPSPDSVPLLLCGGYYALPASVAERHTSILAQINASKWGVTTIAGVEFEQLDVDPEPRLCETCGRWIPCRHCDGKLM